MTSENDVLDHRGPQRPASRVRFGLKAVFFVITIIAAYCAGWLSHKEERARQKELDVKLLQLAQEAAQAERKKEDALAEFFEDYGYVERAFRPPAGLVDRFGEANFDPHLFARIVRVDLKSPDVDRKVLQRLGELTHLESLDLSTLKFELRTQPEPPKPPPMLLTRVVEPSGPKLHEDDLALLANLRLEELCLANTNISDDGAFHLARLTSLKTLSLCRTNITDFSGPYLSKLLGLTALSLEGTNVTGAGIFHLSRIKTLRTLDLSHTKIAEADCAALSEFKQVENLDLFETHLTNDDLEHLSTLVNLRWLDLRGTALTDEGLAHFGQLRRLEYLDLSGSRVSGSGLRYLPKLIHLRFLLLDNAPVSDENTKYLSQFPRIEVISLSRAPITDASAPNFLALPRSLKQLFIWNTGIGLKTEILMDNKRPEVSRGPSIAVPTSPFTLFCGCGR